MAIADSVYSEGNNSHYVISDVTDNGKTLPLTEVTSTNRLLMEGTTDNDLAREINTRLHRVEKMMEDYKPQVIEQHRNVRILKLQWMGIALVLDRFFFFVYLITLSVTLVILFPWPTYN